MHLHFCISDIGLKFSFLCDIFGFGIRVMVAPYNEFESVPPAVIFFFFFFSNLRKIGVNSSLNVWYNSPVKAIWSWTFVYWEFFSFSFLYY